MSGRAVRADALRNRERLLDAAAAAFSAGHDQVSLEAIARDAGVGIGTLYRHFPSRAALIEEVFRNELSRLSDGAGRLLRSRPADVALREWMQRYTRFVATKRGMADALRAPAAAPRTPVRLVEAVQVLLDAGAVDGTLRTDVAAEDVVAGMTGIVRSSPDPAQRAQVGRLLDLLVDGLRGRR